VSEIAAKPLPRHGRIWVAGILTLALLALGYTIVELSTRESGDPVVHLDGINDAQRLFGGVPQEADRFGSSNAPVTIQIFNDMQCGNCREDFLRVIPTLAEDYARPGDVQLLYRHYSNSINTEQLGFYGAEAAAEQNYGWQYIYLFFRNQNEAERFGVDQDYLASVAGGIERLEGAEWEKALEAGLNNPDSAIARQLAEYEQLGRDLKIRTGQAAIVTGPVGTRTLQDGAGLPEIERAIDEVDR
jgi:protein-disulfide isomerase